MENGQQPRQEDFASMLEESFSNPTTTSIAEKANLEYLQQNASDILKSLGYNAAFQLADEQRKAGLYEESYRGFLGIFRTNLRFRYRYRFVAMSLSRLCDDERKLANDDNEYLKWLTASEYWLQQAEQAVDKNIKSRDKLHISTQRLRLSRLYINTGVQGDKKTKLIDRGRSAITSGLECIDATTIEQQIAFRREAVDFANLYRQLLPLEERGSVSRFILKQIDELLPQYNSESYSTLVSRNKYAELKNEVANELELQK